MPQPWILGDQSHVGLSERGNAVLDATPIGAMNGACAGNNVLEMRQGMLNEDLSATGFTGPVLWIGRFVTNEGVEETWAAANNNGVAALARKVNSVWAPVPFSDTPNAANLLFMVGVGMNGKFFLAYDSDVNRLHVWDGSTVRRVGLAPAGTPTAPPTGGVGTTITRSYRQRNVVMTGAVVVRRSEPSGVSTVT